VALGVRGELALGQLQHGMALIEQAQSRLNFQIDAVAVITDHHLRARRGLGDRHRDGMGLGVIQGVIEYLREAVLPNAHDIGG